MGIGRLIYSLKADDLDLERKNIIISPVSDINQMASILNGLVIKNASETEREALKQLFTGKLGARNYTTENGQYTIRLVKHLRWLSFASHKVYLMDNFAEGNKTAIKYGAFFYPTIRKAINQYLYKPGEKNLLLIYKRMWFQLAVFIIILVFLFRGCQKNNIADVAVSDIKRQASVDSKYSASEYTGTGYSITLSDDWKQINADEIGEEFDLTSANYVTLGADADNSAYSVILTKIDNLEGFSGDELADIYLEAIQTSENYADVTSPVLEESKGGYSSYCIEMI